MGSSSLKFKIFAGFAVILLLSAFTSVTVAQCTSPPAGIVSWWAAEGNGNDAFGPVYENGTLVNGVTFSPGKVGTAFDLDGLNDYVAVEPSTAFDFGTGDFAVQAWIYPRAATGDHAIVSRWDIGQGYAWDLRLGWASGGGSPNALYFFFGDAVSGGIPVSGAVSLNQWHHVAVVRRGGVLYGYLDGVEHNAGTQGGNATGPTVRLRIGNFPGYESGHFNGLIDEVGIINTSLSAAQVQAIFNAGTAGICRNCVPAPSGLVSWWPGDGNPFDVLDENNGTLINGATFSEGKVGQAFSFDGADDHVEIPSSTSLNVTRISLSFWFKLNELGRIHELVNKFGPEGSNTIAYGSEVGTDNKACFRLSNDGTVAGLTDICSTTVLTTGVWYHFAGTYDGAQMKIYINGVNEGTVDKTGDIFINNQSLKLGAYGYFPWFLNGQLDEVAIANRALTASEVSAIYDSAGSGICRTCTASAAGTTSWWRAEYSGYDFMGTNNGTPLNGAAFSPGKVGQAFILDGIDDMVVVPDASNLNFSPFEPLTIHMWAYPTESRAMHLIGKRASCFDSGQSANYQIAQDGSGLHFNSGGQIVASGLSLPVNQWSHLAVTYDGSMIRLYLNGTQVAAQGGTLSAVNNGAPVIIGGTCFDAGARFPGMLDEVTIVNAALTAQEIAALTKAGNAGICSFGKDCALVPPGMLASWRAEGNAFDRKKLHSGTLLNETTFDSGIAGKAFAFDGSGGYVSIPAFDMGNDWTVEGWINPVLCSDSQHCALFARSEGPFDGLLISYLGPGHPEFNQFGLNIGNGSVWQAVLRSGTQYAPGHWYHIAASKSGNVYTLYVNGVLADQETVSDVSTGYQTKGITVGLWNYGTAAYLQGKVDDLAVYNRALSTGELAAIYSAATTGLGKCAACQTTADFDGDMLSDLSIFRPNGAFGAEWWTLGSAGGVSAAQFGSATDKVAAADFTGDGKVDIAFWRPDTGFWYILRSDDFTFYAYPFGGSGDIPMPADYDGDGTADAAVFRPSNSYWYINRSIGGVAITQFGAAGDQPVAADYDGDGKADIAVFRPNGTGGAEWWIANSSGGVFATQFGQSTDRAVPADYTGDGRADIAFWNTGNGYWYILRSEDYSYFAFPFGGVGDLPVPADYDGDGKADAGVFRPSNSTWYLNRSTAGTAIQQFGTTGDQPVPNAYVR